MIVEDYPPVRDAVAQALLEEGFTVDIASNGRTGLERIEERPYDALVVDVMMPEMSGLDMVSALRARGDTTPAILLTALDGVDDRVIYDMFWPPSFRSRRCSPEPVASETYVTEPCSPCARANNKDAHR